MSGVGAALRDSRLQGILKGTPNGTTTLQYIMSDEPVKPGERVITSGGDRIFPKGLLVGTVASVEPGKDLFLNIRVIPSARLDRLEEVLVVTKIEEKFPDTKELGPIRASDILSERLPGLPTPPEANAAGSAAAATRGATAPAGQASAPAGVTTRPATGAGLTQQNPNAMTRPATPPGTTAPKPNTIEAAQPATGTTPPRVKPSPSAGTTTGTTPLTTPVQKPSVRTAPDTETTPEQTTPDTKPQQTSPPNAPPTTPPNPGDTPPQ